MRQRKAIWSTCLLADSAGCSSTVLYRQGDAEKFQMVCLIFIFMLLWFWLPFSLPTRKMATTSLHFLRPSRFVYRAFQSEGHCRCLFQLLLCSFPSLQLHSQCPFLYSCTIPPAGDHEGVICH